MNERDIELAKQAGFKLADFLKLTSYTNAIRADEREACAKIVETEAMQYAEPVWAFEIVNDIRARGDK